MIVDVLENAKIDEAYSFSKEELKNTDIIELNNVSIKGNITSDMDDYILDLSVSGIMVLPCAVSLKPVNYDFSFEISENLTDYFNKNKEIYKNNQKTLDILPIIWENILMEIPIRVVSDDLSDVITSGDGWELVADDAKVNPSLAKLKDLL